MNSDDAIRTGGRGLSRRSFLGTIGLTGGVLSLAPALAACGGTSSGAGAGSKSFLLGEVHATTGPAAATYHNYFIPANIAVAELNKGGGVDGKPFAEKLLDDQADPSKVPAVIRQLRQQGVKYIIGPNTSSTSLAAVPLTTQFKMVNLNVSTGDKLNDVKAYPYTFMIGPTNTPAMNAIVDFCAAQGWTKIACLHSDDVFGTQTVDPIKARAAEKGLELVADVVHPVQATDMTPYVKKVQEAKPDAVVCIQAIVSVSTSMFNAFKALDFNVPKIGTTSISSATLREAVSADVYDNTYAVYLKNFSYTDTEPVPPKNVDYVTKIAAEAGDFGGLTTAGLVYGPYDFIHMLKLAVEKAGTDDVEKVISKLEAMEPYDGVAGTIKFTAESHNGLADGELVICSAASGGDAAKSMGGYLLKRA